MVRCSYSVGEPFLDKFTHKQFSYLVSDMFIRYIY